MAQPAEHGTVTGPDRRPLTFSEFALREFEKDKEGNWIDGVPDGNDHSIGAVDVIQVVDLAFDTWNSGLNWACIGFSML